MRSPTPLAHRIASANDSTSRRMLETTPVSTAAYLATGAAHVFATLFSCAAAAPTVEPALSGLDPTRDGSAFGWHADGVRHALAVTSGVAGDAPVRYEYATARTK